MNQRTLTVATLALGALIAVPPVHATHAQREPHAPTLARAVQDAGTFQTLSAALDAARLTDALAGHDRLTLLAPTDEAFAAIPAEVRRKLILPANRSTLAEILTLHVLPGDVAAGDAFAAGRVGSLAGEPVRFGIEFGRLRANGAALVATDRACANGTLHVIDRVLLPRGFDPAALRERPAVLHYRANANHPVHERGVVADRIEISASGGGRVVLEDVEAGVIVTRLSGGATVRVDGVAERHEVRQGGGSVLSALDLRTEVTDARLGGGSTAEVWAERHLAARAGGSSTVRYRRTHGTVETRLDGWSTAVVAGGQVAQGARHR